MIDTLPIIIEQCTKNKNKFDSKVSAIDLYENPRYKQWRVIIKKFNNQLPLFIHSAKYGIIYHKEKISYYDFTFKNLSIQTIVDEYSEKHKKAFKEKIVRLILDKVKHNQIIIPIFYLATVKYLASLNLVDYKFDEDFARMLKEYPIIFITILTNSDYSKYMNNLKSTLGEKYINLDYNKIVETYNFPKIHTRGFFIQKNIKYLFNQKSLEILLNKYKTLE